MPRTVMRSLSALAIVLIVLGLTAVTLWQNEHESRLGLEEENVDKVPTKTPSGDDLTPAQLCDHMLELLMAEDVATRSTSELENIREVCIEEVITERGKMTKDEYDRLASCILAATSLEALKSCAKDYK